MQAAEQVVLVSDDGTPIGVAPKATVHDGATPLHLAFSCHVFDEEGRVLVTRRALAKSTWPGVWTNSFCGHPGPGEAMEDAVVRRASFELGIHTDRIALTLPDFRYRAVDGSGIVENEICPVYRSDLVGDLRPNPDEVVETRWVHTAALRTAIDAAPWAFSPWLVLQARQLY
ncbi:isopentenyl-diphosphate Delta-isomerase [Williamsia soli]|uniref:isopentenyl-diphosphate Delta-isomerase n=1 Tax=Williamsia soli TaxID=364929 RepID=UPI001A9E57F9|nr:isopentenyl-diphosphate Delta-isomerase [Williamsia soli]